MSYDDPVAAVTNGWEGAAAKQHAGIDRKSLRQKIIPAKGNFASRSPGDFDREDIRDIHFNHMTRECPVVNAGEFN